MLPHAYVSIGGDMVGGGKRGKKSFPLFSQTEEKFQPLTHKHTHAHTTEHEGLSISTGGPHLAGLTFIINLPSFTP